MEHLALEVFDLATKENPNPTGSQYAVLEPDATITITDASDIFDSGDVWSHPFTLNVTANAHIFGTSGDMHGSRLHEQIDKRHARLWIEGLPLYMGILRLDAEAEVDKDGNVDITFESGRQSFNELIEGAKANQVPLMNDVQIGWALWRKRKVGYGVKLDAFVTFGDGDTRSGHMTQQGQLSPTEENDYVVMYAEGEDQETPTQQYPRMVFPKGEFLNIQTNRWEEDNFINTDNPYTEDEDGTPTHPYCNVALCYQKYGYEKKNENGDIYYDYNSEPEAQRGYELMPACRLNSAPNFYVIYWIRSLMHHLGIHVDENQMLGVEDLRRLFMVNTNCSYELPKQMRTLVEDNKYGRYGRRRAAVFQEEWEYDYIPERIDEYPLINVEESGFSCTYEGEPEGEYISQFTEEEKTIKKVVVKIDRAKSWGENASKDVPTSVEYENWNSYYHKAFATSECFPDVEVSEIITALESAFGVRFLFSDNYKRVRIVLLRNLFNSAEVQNIDCDIISDSKIENNIRGFRMTYGNTEDTHFYYKGFADLLPHKKELWVDNSDKHDYSQWSLNEEYADLLHKVSAFDTSCFVTPLTGNSYGIKVDKNAKRYDDLHPSLFELAGFMDAEDGDCTGDEETIKEISLNFSPAIMNDLNMEDERKGSHKQQFALFLEETMRPRRPDIHTGEDYNDPTTFYDIDGKLFHKREDGEYDHRDAIVEEERHGETFDVVKPGEFAITSDMRATANNLKVTVEKAKPLGQGFVTLQWHLTLNIDGHLNEGYRLYLQDNYEPNDDGVSPIETHNWGLTLGIMRGSGSDAYVEYSADPEDREGNDTWEIVPGSSVTAHPDICDSYGKIWDYNGSIRITTPSEAATKLTELFSGSDAPFNDAAKGYITGTVCILVHDAAGNYRTVLLASSYSRAGQVITGSGDIRYFVNLTLEQLIALSQSGRHMFIEADSSDERGSTLVQLCRMAYGGSSEAMTIDNGVGSQYGRVSLKLRAEKPNPDYNRLLPESSLNPRYLPIEEMNLRKRGLCDKFYKEYSYWIRNARIAKRLLKMELAQLLAIDKSKKITVGDITGFVRKMQFSVSNKDGLSLVDMEIMYI